MKAIRLIAPKSFQACDIQEPNKPGPGEALFELPEWEFVELT